MKKSISACCFFDSRITTIAFAKLTVIERWSSNTYVQSYHLDDFFADTYTVPSAFEGLIEKFVVQALVFIQKKLLLSITFKAM